MARSLFLSYKEEITATPFETKRGKAYVFKEMPSPLLERRGKDYPYNERGGRLLLF